MIVVVFENNNGGLSVAYPAYNDKLRPANDSDDDLLARVVNKVVPSGKQHVKLDVANLPSDLTGYSISNNQLVQGA